MNLQWLITIITFRIPWNLILDWIGVTIALLGMSIKPLIGVSKVNNKVLLLNSINLKKQGTPSVKKKWKSFANPDFLTIEDEK